MKKLRCVYKISFCTQKSLEILSKKEKLFGMMSLEKQTASSTREEEMYLTDVMNNASDTRSRSGRKSTSSLPTESSSHSYDVMETGSFVDEVNVSTNVDNQPDDLYESLDGKCVYQATLPLLAHNNDTSALGLIMGETIQDLQKGGVNERESNIKAANDDENYLSSGTHMGSVMFDNKDNVLDNIQMPSRNDNRDASTSVFSHASCGTSSGSFQSKVASLEPVANYTESAEYVESEVSAKMQEYQPSWTIDRNKHVDIEQLEMGHLPSGSQMILPRKDFVAEREGKISNINTNASNKMEETEDQIVSSKKLGCRL